MTKDIISGIKPIFVPCQGNNWRPKFLESSFLFHYLIFLFLLKLIAISFLFYFPKTIFFADITKTALINLVNQERTALGVAPLKENLKLNQTTFLKAKDILEKDYFSHYSPGGVSPWHWFKIGGYDYTIAGENLAIGFLDSEEVYQTWLNSPSHRANLLNPEYKEVGITVLKGDFQGNEVQVVVQHFGSPEVQPAQKPIQEEQPFPASEKETLPSPSLTETPESKGEKKEILSEAEKPLTKGETEEKISITEEEKKIPVEPQKPVFAFQFLSLFNSYYYQILQIIIYMSLFFIIIALLISIFIRIDIQHKDLIFKTLGVIGLLILFILLDREVILVIIPHNFSI